VRLGEAVRREAGTDDLVRSLEELPRPLGSQRDLRSAD
jgi:hypothetical protein